MGHLAAVPAGRHSGVRFATHILAPAPSIGPKYNRAVAARPGARSGGLGAKRPAQGEHREPWAGSSIGGRWGGGVGVRPVDADFRRNSTANHMRKKLNQCIFRHRFVTEPILEKPVGHHAAGSPIATKRRVRNGTLARPSLPAGPGPGQAPRPGTAGFGRDILRYRPHGRRRGR